MTRKVREGRNYKRIMAITGHKAFAVFQRYNNPTEGDVKAVVLANPPRKVVGSFSHMVHTEDLVSGANLISA